MSPEDKQVIAINIYIKKGSSDIFSELEKLRLAYSVSISIL